MSLLDDIKVYIKRERQWLVGNISNPDDISEDYIKGINTVITTIEKMIDYHNLGIKPVRSWNKNDT